MTPYLHTLNFSVAVISFAHGPTQTVKRGVLIGESETLGGRKSRQIFWSCFVLFFLNKHPQLLSLLLPVVSTDLDLSLFPLYSLKALLLTGFLLCKGSKLKTYLVRKSNFNFGTQCSLAYSE